MKLAITADFVVILNSFRIVDSRREHQVVTFAGNGSHIRSVSRIEFWLRLISVCLPLPNEWVFVRCWDGWYGLARGPTRKHHARQDDEQVRFHNDDLVWTSVSTRKYYADAGENRRLHSLRVAAPVNECNGDFSPVIPLPSFGVRVDFRHGFNSSSPRSG